MDKPLINRVANSGLVTINLEDFFPKEKVVIFDLKDYLYMELILKEKDFRTALKEHDWTQYQGVNLLVICSNGCNHSCLGLYASDGLCRAICE